MNSNQALNGLRILDFSTLLPGPFASLYLADLGAEVTHIVSPYQTDLMRELEPFADGRATAHAYLNRNKHSLALDLKDPENIAQIYDKIGEYDIVIEQFRPGVMQRLGLDYPKLQQIHPGLIYCSITGFGQTGPMRHKAGHDINFLARSGIASQCVSASGQPVPMGVQLGDVAGGAYHAVIAILAAVIERARSGLGQAIDISMTDCVAALNTMSAAAALAGNTKPRVGHEPLNGGSFYNYYQTQDGRYLAVGGIETKFRQGLAQILQIEQLADPDLSFDQLDYSTLQPKLIAAFQTKTLAQWQALFAEQDLCVEPVLYVEEALQSELAQARLWVVQVPISDDTLETQAQLGCPIKFSRSSMRYDFIGQLEPNESWEALSKKTAN